MNHQTLNQIIQKLDDELSRLVIKNGFESQIYLRDIQFFAVLLCEVHPNFIGK
jgi:hypothetical protein